MWSRAVARSFSMRSRWVVGVHRAQAEARGHLGARRPLTGPPWVRASGLLLGSQGPGEVTRVTVKPEHTGPRERYRYIVMPIYRRCVLRRQDEFRSEWKKWTQGPDQRVRCQWFRRQWFRRRWFRRARSAARQRCGEWLRAPVRRAGGRQGTGATYRPVGCWSASPRASGCAPMGAGRATQRAAARSRFRWPWARWSGLRPWVRPGWSGLRPRPRDGLRSGLGDGLRPRRSGLRSPLGARRTPAADAR
jgi:hypothetical protein